MSSPNLPLGARSFIFTTTRGKRCTAILKVVQSSNVRTTTARNPRLSATATTTTTTLTTLTTSTASTPGTIEATRDEVTEPAIPSTSPSPLLEDTILPSSTPVTISPTITSKVAITSISAPLLSSSTAVADESFAGQESFAGPETSAITGIEPSLGPGIGKATASAIFPDDAVATSFASTVPNLQPSSAKNAEKVTETPLTIPTISSVESTNSNSEAAKVAGGVLSGLVVLSVIGLFFWLWRRRRVNKRRNTLLTPLGPGPHTDSTEKAPYTFSRRSIGPTSLFAKVKAALGYNVKKIRERISQTFSEPSIRLSPSSRPQSRGFLASHGRNPSSFLFNESNGADTLKDRIVNWWSKVTSHITIGKRLGLRLRSDDEVVRDRYTDVGKKSERKTSLQHQPDFLTLLAMDDGDLSRGGLGRQGQQQQHKAATLQPPGFKESNDPFRDDDNNNNNNNNIIINTLSHISAIPAPLASVATSNNRSADNDTNNPFSDPLPQRTTSDRRRRRRQSRGQQSISVSAGAANHPSRQPSTRTYRESIDSFTTLRDKFRSDPFDLERPELLGVGVGGGITGVGVGVARGVIPVGVGEAATAPSGGPIRHPPSVHTRQESLGGGGGSGLGRGSSRRYSSSYSYSSGVVSSLGEDDGWNDPGPDVGPAAVASLGTGGYKRVRGASLYIFRSIVVSM
ncbi:hypothetical protein B0T20DRAFT_483609 [Sordaria brevicollis]|uniref:Uncharacterized protein n=1 Tax=Sordaria brevicollis TaxID=83679 RepID=A0AAE0P1F6_SORBR|nr:hypothetical protein B0T20DRAFT_483609 [Sordaria brevicollis]